MCLGNALRKYRRLRLILILCREQNTLTLPGVESINFAISTAEQPCSAKLRMRSIFCGGSNPLI